METAFWRSCGFCTRLRFIGAEKERDTIMAMHYPRRVSRIKRVRSIGFRARMRTRNGRKIISRKRRLGRRINVAAK